MWRHLLATTLDRCSVFVFSLKTDKKKHVILIKNVDHVFCQIFQLWRFRLVSLWQHFDNRRTIYSYFDFGLKNSSFRLPYQRPSSSTDCTRELFNGSNGSASLVDCTRKKIFCLGVRVFCE